MKNKLVLLGLAFVILGAGAGLHYRIPIVIVLVCVGVALFSAVTGVQMILSRKAVIPTSDSLDTNKEYHSGLSAQFWGVLFLMFSVPLGVFGIVYWLYGDEPPAAIIERMVRSPLVSGLGITATGTGIVLYGLTRLIAGKAAFVETRVGPFERAVMGTYSVALGTLVAAVGLVRTVAPGTLTRLRDSAIAWALTLVK